MHFMNPPPLMKLVEIIRGLRDRATPPTRRRARSPSGWARQTVLSRDISGFIVNRVLMPMLNEACFALYEGIGVGRRHRQRRSSSGSTTRWGRSR